jgi:hypothetical protein
MTRLLLAVFLLGACAKRNSASGSERETTVDLVAQASRPASVTPTDPSADLPRGSDAALTVANPRTPPASQADSTAVAPANPAPAATSMIIRTGTASVQVDSLERAVAQVKQLAARLGGYVANSSESGGSQNVRQASLELKLPAAQWDHALAGLRPLGKLESQQTTAEDVGEEFVDVAARVANARRLEGRLIDLLATRTGKLEDVLAVETELARVREEIERYEGRMRFLRGRVSLSTLVVTLHEPNPTLGPGSSPILDAFRTAWRNFVGFVAGFIASLGWLLPLLAIAWVGVAAIRRILARRPMRPGPPPPAPVEPNPRQPVSPV